MRMEGTEKGRGRRGKVGEQGAAMMVRWAQFIMFLCDHPPVRARCVRSALAKWWLSISDCDLKHCGKLWTLWEAVWSLSDGVTSLLGRAVAL